MSRARRLNGRLQPCVLPPYTQSNENMNCTHHVIERVHSQAVEPAAVVPGEGAVERSWTLHYRPRLAHSSGWHCHGMELLADRHAAPQRDMVPRAAALRRRGRSSGREMGSNGCAADRCDTRGSRLTARQTLAGRARTS